MADRDDTSLDYLSMSDEEIRNMTGPVATANEEVPDEEVAEQQETGAEVPLTEESTEQDPNAEADDEEGEQPDEEVEAEGGDGEKTVLEPTSAESAEKEKPAESDSGINYKAEYERLLAPFKANGRDIKVDSVDDAIALMQMGANYNKKMAALKPNLKLMKMLEHNNLLSEEKLSFLIDLEKKNPAAITKLVKDSGLDPMDLDTEKASEYRQTTYAVDDREIELDTILDELQSSPAYNQTLDVIANKWDAASKQVIAGAPQLLRVINDHIANGIYDVISQEVERERVFGRLNGLSDIEAYRRVGDVLHAKGAFNHLVPGSSQPQRKPAAGAVVAPPKPKVVDDVKLKDKKRAASPSKAAVSGSLPADFNPLALSDEEFSKLINKNLL